MADQINFTPLRALDSNGLPVAAAEALFYISGTSTLQTVYADAAGTVPHPQPLVADARGLFAQVYSAVNVKVSVASPSGTILPGFPLDPAYRTVTNGSGAASITFSPTVEIPVTNVQAAIEQVQDNLEVVAAEIASIPQSPSGLVAFFAMSSAPTGYLKADGSLVSRATYAALFTAIGTTFGVGDGSTTFALPDLRGEFVRGWDDGRGIDSARAIGSFQTGSMLNHTHTGTTSTDGAHTHTIPATGGGANPSVTAASNDNGTATRSTNSGGSHNHTLTTGNPSTGGGTETRPRNIALLACIKY